jgi:hypothetical protein
MPRLPIPALILALSAALAARSAHADDPNVNTGGVGAYFADWFVRSDAAKASQPHWMTPLVTVTPRLEQEVRYDQYWQTVGNGVNVNQWNSGKGIELIPTHTNEVLINAAPYLVRGSGKHDAEGWGDWQFLVVKQRLFTANEQNGNYVVSAFLGVQAPVGNPAFTNRAWVVTPTIAAGKGWGPFDIQSTLGVSVPTSRRDVIGNTLAWNTAFQYHLLKYFWPEFETNLTHWFDGQRSDKTQLFLTSGLVLGRFQLYGRAP